MQKDVDAVAAAASRDFERTIERLCAYVRHPAISSEPAHAADVKQLAERIRADLAALAPTRTRLLELPDALPCVAAEWLGAGPDRPTVLIYGHLDIQPVAGQPWSSPPHEPTRRGDRLFARGIADDMGGWVSHLAAMEAWLGSAGRLPCNVKLLIEGEEEIGSPNLERYMDAFTDAFSADVMVLTDCENPSTDVPGLTTSLRGLMEVEVTCEALAADVHSGLWGGAVPDASVALVQILARLVDERGRLRLARREISDAERTALRAAPITPELVRRGAHLRDGVDPLPEDGRPLAEWMWRQPAVTIVATTLPVRERKANAIRARASATLSIRLAPGHQGDEVLEAVRAELVAHAPGGVAIEVREAAARAQPWLYVPRGPAFAAADRAYEKAWGKKLVQIGVGGSIPFVATFGRRFGDLPLILNGVLDPESSAHGPDESLHVDVLRKAILANVHLLHELGELGKSGLGQSNEGISPLAPTGKAR